MMYEIVTKYTGVERLTIEEITEKYVDLIYRYNDNHRQRAELQGQPMIKNLLGPMWGGHDEKGNPIIRYESQEVYNKLSQ